MVNKTLSQTILSGWQMKQIKDLLSYERPDKYIVESEKYINNGTPVLTANKSFILGYTDEKDGIYNDVPAIIFDDFTTDSKFVDFSFKVKSSAIKILKERNNQTDIRFIYEKMKSINFPTGSHKRYYISQYQNMEVVVPPLPEQKKIAEILGTVDDEIRKTDEVIVATEKLKRGLMQQLFTRGIGHTKFKKTEIGEIPEGWIISKLSEVAKVERGKFSHRPRNAPEFYGGDIPFIQTGDVVDSNGKISSYTQTLNEKGLSVSKLFRKGTIVITIAANIGDTGILQFDSCFPDSLVGITPSEKIDAVFLEYYLRTKKEYLNSISTQSAQKNINLEKLNPLLVVLPAKDEQQKIAEIMSSIDEKISINQKLKGRLTFLKKGLMQDLLSGRVRANI
ncbi:restriction endonuclease subunit S [Candidatus Parcubacteria bacterium]|nr:MAG: restriction endonuclease subunit S [Candidatus Parcubacteria bacterium]